MALDQYLSARRYISAWDHSSDTERAMYTDIAKSVGQPEFKCEGSPHLYIEISVAYWRKANQIHKWFVEHVQSGKDNCGTYYVSRERLSELRDLCRKVLEQSDLIKGTIQRCCTTYSKEGVKREFTEGDIIADPTAAIDLLPTKSGFFFGGTDYDQYYFADLETTVTQIDQALTRFDKEWSFKYHSSW